MEGSKKIEHEIGGLKNDAFRFGLQGVKSDIVGSHPLESAFQSKHVYDDELNVVVQAIVREENMKRKILANTYGSAFSVKQELDRKILSRFQRPPGLVPSSMLGLESLTGALDDFGVHDTETTCIPDMHHGMEVRVGISKGPIHPSFV
ncbi:Proteasome maturation factor UMP1 [Cynara cardunculus var. scolymus]|uniref:Proteasome maturation factor UMP1 n=1 Tax=Cynara cardunculus var. scolymus TaxID=59895 RepID=A0A124SFA4_CYNCS|nr:Proteasome maturation factor UMP1 [Cynara cardunculus var. scolymus]